MRTSSSSTELHYDPLVEPEDDFTMVRRHLRTFVIEEQHHGSIPADVLPEELWAEVEQYVPRIVRILQQNAPYTHLITTTEKEVFLAGLIRQLFYR